MEKPVCAAAGASVALKSLDLPLSLASADVGGKAATLGRLLADPSSCQSDCCSRRVCLHLGALELQDRSFFRFPAFIVSNSVTAKKEPSTTGRRHERLTRFRA